jgi:hypothetical protein
MPEPILIEPDATRFSAICDDCVRDKNRPFESGRGWVRNARRSEVGAESSEHLGGGYVKNNRRCFDDLVEAERTYTDAVIKAHPGGNGARLPFRRLP